MAASVNPPSGPLPAAIAALAEFDQFIVWKLQPGSNGGKFRKVPINPETLNAASALDPALWLSAERAYQYVALFNASVTSIQGGALYGVGFVLSVDDPIFCLDIDDCLIAEWSALALDLIQRLPGTAIEVSHSGRGLHIWGMARPMPLHGCHNTEHNIEL